MWPRFGLHLGMVLGALANWKDGKTMAKTPIGIKWAVLLVARLSGVVLSLVSGAQARTSLF